MLDLLKDRRVAASGIAVVAVAIIAFLLSRSLNTPLLTGGSDHGSAALVSSDGSAKTAAPGEKTATASTGSQPSLGGAPQGASGAASPSQPSPDAGSSTTSGDAPSFDIVRVSPDGSSVIAARGAPNTELALRDGDTVIAHAKTDATGQVAFLPPPLAPGGHSLTLTSGDAATSSAVSSQSVAVAVPEQAKEAPLVAVLQPGEKTKVLSGATAGSATPGSGLPQGSPVDQAQGSEAIQSVEVEEAGSFFASGNAAPGSQSRLYLNGAFVATVTADDKGLWSLKIKHGMKPGHYAVRADQVEGKSGAVTARAEVPFDYPASPLPGGTSVATAAKPGKLAGAMPGAPATPAAPVVAQGTTGAPGQQQVAGSALSNGGEPSSNGQASASATSAATATTADTSQAPGSVARTTPNVMAASSGTTSASTATGNPSAIAAQSNAPDASSTAPAPTAVASTGPSSASSFALGAKGLTNYPALDAKAGTGTAATPSTPGQVASTSADTPLGSSGGTTVIDELVTAKVFRGDTLWRISRKMLGNGMRYTQIYAANSQQIRNPHKIYPGQILVMPHTETE